MSNETANGFTFTWKIENYSLCPQRNGESLVSPPFTTENVGDSIWLLLLYPRGEDKGTEDYISLYLNRFKGDIRTDINNIGVELKIINSNGNTLQIIKGEDVFLHEGYAWGSKMFFKRIRMGKAMETWKEDSITVCCTIVNKKQLSSKAKTKIDAEHYSFKWNVGISNNMDISKKNVYDTSLFKINLLTSEESIKLSVCKQKNITIFPKQVSCRISLLNKDGCEVDSKRSAHSFVSDEEDYVWEFPDFITTTYLKENEGRFLKNGTFALLFEFSFTKEKEFINILIPDGNNYPNQNNIINLKENFRNMYASRLHSDVEFRVDGKQFHAHKSILAARSPVFSAMFDQDMLESRTGIVNIAEVENNILELFLAYLYTGTVDYMDWEVASKLLIVADLYQVEALKVDCSCFLKSNLSKKNVYEVLELSDMINYKHLKEFVFHYVAENANEILASSEWMNWVENNARLSGEVISSIANTV